MKRFTESIRAAVIEKNWFAALFLALAAPDVCGALEAPSMGVGERYKSWFSRYLKRKYDPANLYELVSETSPQSNLACMPPQRIEYLKSLPTNTECAFTAEDCYRFRCKCLHQGRALKDKDKKIHFTAPDKAGIVTFHMSSFNGLYQLQIDIFCLDVCLAVERWLVDVSGNSEIQSRMSEMIEIYNLDDQRVPLVEYKKRNTK